MKVLKVMGTIFLMTMVVFFLFSMTAMSKGKLEEQELRRYYAEKEKETTTQIRSFLEEEGFYNSGLKLTRVSDGENRAYTMTIHHGKIDRMTEAERAELMRSLEQQIVPMAYSTMEYRFFIQ